MKKAILSIFLLLALVGSVAATQARCPAGSEWVGNSPVAYANAVVSTSGSVSNAGNAVGVDDNTYAYIYATNPDSYIVLDMGEGEEIWDRFGMDFRVYQDNSRDDFGVQVYVSNSPTSGWEWVGFSDGRGDDDFTIRFTSYDSVRYVAISNSDRDTGRNDRAERVEIDAVRGFCITEPSDDDPEVPEFGVLAAIGVLGLAGLFIYRKRQ